MSRHMVKAFDALGCIHSVAVGQGCAAWTWSDGDTFTARHAIVIDCHFWNFLMVETTSSSVKITLNPTKFSVHRLTNRRTYQQGGLLPLQSDMSLGFHHRFISFCGEWFLSSLSCLANHSDRPIYRPHVMSL